MKTSIKCGCKAQFRVKKEFNNEKIYVCYYGGDINHEPRSLDSWRKRRLSPRLSNWLKEVVAGSISWESFKRLSRPDEETLKILESGQLTSEEPVSVSEMVRVRPMDFYNYRSAYLKSIV